MRRPNCWASSRATSISTTCARNSSATSSSRCSAPTRCTRATYLLGTSIARPLIAKRQIEIANEVGADAVAHGATGKGNDQVRFELGYYALKPDIKVIAPWRVWDLNSRTRLLDYAEQHQIPIAKDKRGEAPYSTDANLLHISYEGKALEDPWVEPDEDMFTRSVSPEKAPDTPTYVEVEFRTATPSRSMAWRCPRPRC